MHRGPYYKHREGGSGGWNPYEKRSVPETVQLNAETKKPIGLVSREAELADKAAQREAVRQERQEARVLREQALREAIEAANGSYTAEDDDWLAEALNEDPAQTSWQTPVRHDATLHGQPGWDAGDTLSVDSQGMTREQEVVQDTENLLPDDTMEMASPYASQENQPGPDQGDMEDYRLERADGTVVTIETQRIDRVEAFLEDLQNGEPVTIGSRVDESRDDRPLVPNQFVMVRALGGGGMGATYLARRPGQPDDAPPEFVIKLHARKVDSERSIKKSTDALRRTAMEEISFLHEFTDLAEGIRRFEDNSGKDVILTAMKLAKGKPGSLYEQGRRILRDFDANQMDASDRVAVEAARELQSERGTLTIARSFGRVLDQLISAQARGVMHGDIKPANIIISEDGSKSTLIDAGLSRQVVARDGTLLHFGARKDELRGTPSVMLPDLWAGDPERHILNADVYAAALSFAEMLGVIELRPVSTPAELAIRSIQGRALEAPDIKRMTGRAKFVERFGMHMLPIYQILSDIVQPMADIQARRAAWKEAGLMHGEEDAVFENASMAKPTEFAARAQTYDEEINEKDSEGYDGEALLDSIAELDAEVSLENLDVLQPNEVIDLQKLRQRVAVVEEQLEGMVTGEYPVVGKDVAQRWIETGDLPQAA